MKKLLFIFITMFFLPAAPAEGQIATTYLGFGGGLTEGLGEHNPNFTPYFGSDMQPFPHLSLNAQANVYTANKIDAGSGTELSTVARGYWRANALEFGGGFSFTRMFTKDYDKSAWHPRVGMRYTKGDKSFLLDYILPQGDRQNAARGVYGYYNLRISNRFDFRYEMELLRYHQTFPGPAPGTPLQWSWGGTATASLVFRISQDHGAGYLVKQMVAGTKRLARPHEPTDVAASPGPANSFDKTSY